jgi:NADPH:quinone reductase-like Zn-dependent oxidoreductase
MPYVIRAMDGLRSPRQAIRGVDHAGRVQAVGYGVTAWQPGDEVFGGGNGSFAELAMTREDRLAPKPTSLTHQQAAALYVAGMTALQGLSKANVQPGQRVLVNGAGGGVGTFTVQVAKWLGAHVTAVTRSESVDVVRSLGADEVIDYRRDDFTLRRGRYDVVFDLGGTRPLASCRRVLSAKGTLLVVGAPPGRWLAPLTRLLQVAVLSPFVRQRLVPFLSGNDATALALLRDMAEKGAIRPVIDRSWPLAEAAEAICHVGQGRARGKVVLEVLVPDTGTWQSEESRRSPQPPPTSDPGGPGPSAAAGTGPRRRRAPADPR